jgi:hypothetical protein
VTAILGDEVDSAMWRFSPVSLDDADATAALRTRVDRKYVIDEPMAALLLTEMDASVTGLEIAGLRSFHYVTTYFDTEDRQGFVRAARRRPDEFKVRVRSYQETRANVLEVKRKSRRGETVKTRIPYSMPSGATLDDAGCEFVDEVLATHGLARCLRAAVTTSFVRSTVVDTAIGWRATVDRLVRMSEGDGRRAELAGVAIVETKSVAAPTPMDRWLWARHHRPRTISKYGVGTAALHHDLPANKWHRVLLRYVQVDDSAPEPQHDQT